MGQIYITDVTIQKVRHLENISIPLSAGRMKHLILTGKNGSGKTSVVEALAGYLKNVFTDEYFEKREVWLDNARREKEKAVLRGAGEGELFTLEQKVAQNEEEVQESRRGLEVQFNQKAGEILGLREKYHYILAYYKTDRIFRAVQPEHVEKIHLKEYYGLEEFPRNEFVKYLLDLKTVEAFARPKDPEKANEIQAWFQSLEQLLKRIFDDETVALDFDEDAFQFHILQKGKEPFDFNTLSSGYQAVLDIVLDVIMRMSSQTGRSFVFQLPGIVLVDEIETHLHLELQKSIMPLLTVLFPNIQFIVTSHSPFILNSLEDVVIYDLENNILVEHLLPHKNGTYPERKFDWENLFWSCGHCNGVKNSRKYDEGILDCCKHDPEKYLNFRLQEDGVAVDMVNLNDVIQQRTALLVTETFTVKNTGMRTYTSAERIKLLQKEMNKLYQQLEKIREAPNSKATMQIIRSLLRRESAFAAFKRCYVRAHAAEYPELQQYVALVQ